jgi:hypothetical protein
VRGGVAFGVALIAIAALATLEAMLPISRFISKIDQDIFVVAKGVFVHSVLPRLAIGIGLAAIAVYLRVHDNRLAWPTLLLTPIGVLAADFIFRIFSI